LTNDASRGRKRAASAPEINSRQLRAVLAVVEYRSFIAAAAHLGTSQPALTMTIKKLEAALGLSLFLRTTRQVTLTVAGREFAAMAERVSNDLKLSMRSLRELTEQQRGQVIVASLPPLPMSGVVAEYGRRFPGIEIQLREGLQDDIRDDVRSGLADFGVGYLSDLPDSYVSESLGVEELCVVLSKDEPLARARQIEFAALRDVAMVSFGAGSTIRRLADAAATAAGFTLRHAVVVNLPLTLMNLVASGVGVAIVPARPSPLHSNLVLRPLVRPRLSSEIGIMRLRDRELSRAAAGMLALTRERLRIGRPS
jgi:LysR family transcriptional regulator, carnitine catabolism transcriptional activator